MGEIYRVAGYIKLAKLWEKRRKSALAYHKQYYLDKVKDHADYILVDVYVDITGKKEICKRMEMVRLLKDCRDGKIDIILTPTRAYLAPNTGSLCYLLKYLFDLKHKVEIITEDEQLQIDTIHHDGERENMQEMAEKYVGMGKLLYESWKLDVVNAMSEV